MILTIPLILWACRISINELIFHSEFTTLRWNVIGFSVLISASVIAVTVEKIVNVFNIIGGVIVPVIVYVLPAIYFFKLASNSIMQKILSFFFIIFGFSVSALCLYNSIISMI